MTPDQLLDKAANLIWPAHEHDSHYLVVGFLRGELHVCSSLRKPPDMLVADRLRPAQLRNGIGPAEWNQLCSQLWMIYERLHT